MRSVKTVVTWLNPTGVNRGQKLLALGCVWLPPGSEERSHTGSLILLGGRSLRSCLQARGIVSGQRWGPCTLPVSAPTGPLASGF